MKLQRFAVSGAGIKGQTFQVDLGGVVVFAGPNGSGKSTRLLAVLAGLRGLAESSSDPVREYLGPAPTNAIVDLDFDGLRLSRSLADGPRTAGAKRADVLAEQVAGAHLVRWDLADLSQSAPAERGKLLQRVCDLAPGAWTTTRALDELGESAAKLRVAVPPVEPVGRWLGLAIEWAKEEYTRANGALKQATASLESLASQDDAPMPSSAAVGDELRQVEADLEQAHRDARAYDAWAGHQRLLEKQRGYLDRCPDVGPIPDLAPFELALRQASAEVGVCHNALVKAGAAVAAANAVAHHAAAKCRHCGVADPLGKTAGILQESVAKSDLEEAQLDYDTARLVETQAHRALDAARLQAASARRRVELIQGLEALQAEAPPQVSHPGARLSDLTIRLQELRAIQDSAVRAAERERLYAKTAAAKVEAAERFDAIKALGMALKDLRERVAAEAFAPLEREASSITEPVLGGRVQVLSAADFGLLRDSVYVSWWALSDGERAVMGAAMAYAFARVARPKWRAVILDGAEAVDGDRLALLLGELERRVSLGDLDNVLVAVRADKAPEWALGHVIWLGGK